MSDSIDPRLADAFDKAAAEILAPYKEPISTIYMDSDWLYDYRLGEVLLSCKNEAEYNYVVDNIEAYQNGRYNQVTYYFPKLGLIERDLDMMEEDPEALEMVHLAAPATNILLTLGTFIVAINTHNRSKETTKPVTLIINQRRLEMPMFVRARLLHYLHDVDPTLNVKFTKNTSWADMSQQMFKALDIVFIYDVEDFCSGKSVAVSFMRDMEMQGKVAYARVRSNILYDDKKLEEEEFNNFDMVMTMLFKDFRDEKILIPVQRK